MWSDWLRTHKDLPVSWFLRAGIKNHLALKQFYKQFYSWECFCHLWQKVNGMITVTNIFILHLSLSFFLALCFPLSYLFNMFFYIVYSGHGFPSFISSQILLSHHTPCLLSLFLTPPSHFNSIYNIFSLNDSVLWTCVHWSGKVCFVQRHQWKSNVLFCSSGEGPAQLAEVMDLLSAFRHYCQNSCPLHLIL